MGIINEELVLQAIELMRPTVSKIFKQTGTTWGPKWVVGYINTPGLDTAIKFEFGRSPKKIWRKKWGNPSIFCKIAKKNRAVAEREQMATSLVAKLKPWVFKKEEFLYLGGSYSDEISCGVSGAKEQTDEAIGEILINIIKMLAFLETDSRIEKKQMEI
ncbi:MAG: hypothetical protein KAR54_01920 [Candidatus Pacebacteria bacterium]|nr:hypothetical protein [Candidatus Paceibacterota bacterium]